MIALKPNDAAAHANRALTLHQMRRFDEALAGYERVLALNPDDAETYCNRGVCLQELGRLEEALASHDRALALKPDFSVSLFNRGNVLKHFKRFDEALASYDGGIALKPDYPEAHCNRGIILKELMRTDDALASFDRAVSLKPDYAAAYYNRGALLQEMKQLDAAVASFDRAIALSSDDPKAYYSRGNALTELMRYDEAVASHDHAIALKPDYAEAYSNRGIALIEMERFDEALSSYDRGIALKPSDAEAYYNRGNLLNQLHRFDEAVGNYDRAIALKPGFAKAHYNCGIALMHQRDTAAAMDCYNRALQIDPDYADAHFNKSMLLLLAGDFEKGWDLYDWRWRKEQLSAKPLITGNPKWAAGGEKKRVLVWPEQGIGDELMFGSLLPELRMHCSKLIAKVDHRLIPLLARSMPEDLVFIPSHKAVDDGEFDEHVPMGDLCKYFRTSERTFELTRAGYIIDDRERTESIQGALRDRVSSDRKICGVSWRSRNEKTGAKRSLDLKAFIELLALDDFAFVSLQYGATDEEIETVKRDLGVDVLAYEGVDNFSDIDGLASLIQACDVVVSVDNSTVHLAGALGKDVRILLPYFPEWRWQLDRNDSPWYQSARLYRQESDGQWGPVFEKVRADLSRLD